MTSLLQSTAVQRYFTMTLATHILPTVIIGRTLSTHPYRLRLTDEIIIAQFGRVQGAAR